MTTQSDRFLQIDQHLISMLRRQNITVNQRYTDTKVETRGPVFDEYDICLIIPAYGRSNHLKQSLNCLVPQRDELIAQGAKVQIVVSEMSSSPEHASICERLNVSYVYTSSEVFNKSFAMNKAAESFLSDSFIFYDVDMVTGKEWLRSCLQFLNDKKQEGDDSWVMQPIPGRQILYVDEKNTASIFSGQANLEQIPAESHKIQPSWYAGNFPPGGSVMISSELLYAIQGYDPGIFWGYSPEDRCFLKNACVLSQAGKLHTWDISMNDRGCQMYHLHHPETHMTNDSHEYMVLIDSLIDGLDIRGFFIHDKMRSNTFSRWTAADQNRYPPHISSMASRVLGKNNQSSSNLQVFLDLLVTEIRNAGITNSAMMKSYDNILQYAVGNHKYINACLF